MSKYTIVVEALKDEFPKVNKSTVSMALHTEDYGVKFCQRAQEIYETVAHKKPHSQKRKKVWHFQYRLTEDMARQVRQAMQEDGIASVQTWHELLVRDFLRKRKAASGANTDDFSETNEQEHITSDREEMSSDDQI